MSLILHQYLSLHFPLQCKYVGNSELLAILDALTLVQCNIVHAIRRLYKLHLCFVVIVPNNKANIICNIWRSFLIDSTTILHITFDFILVFHFVHNLHHSTCIFVEEFLEKKLIQFTIYGHFNT